MKKALYTTLILLSASLTARAQSTGTSKGITIDNLRTEITGEEKNKTLSLAFDLSAQGLEMTCDGQLILEFAIESADRRLVLPVVVYSGTTRYRYERRREALSGAYIMEPYAIYKGVKKNKTYKLEYKQSIPYYTWMEHASVTCREYTHDCGGDRLNGNSTLVADLNPAPVYLEPEIWKPRPELYPNLVSFLVPDVEQVKARASMIELGIGFYVNKTDVNPAFGNNAYELARADSLIQAIDNPLIVTNSVSIRGYASPEGKYSHNEYLARGRSENFKKWLANQYPSNTYVRNAQTSWVPEDWEGFARMVEADNTISQKQDVLAIVNDADIAPDRKDVMLQNIVWWSSNYKVILKEMYPKLRRIELRVDYTVQNLTDAQARELLYTNPDMLSLEEIFRVAKYYEPGSKQYREVYEIAARQYPNDVIANNNAAAALLQEGKAEQALVYLAKTQGNDNSLINYGAYYYILEDLDKATEYFTKAKQAGIPQAEHNLRLINPAKQ